MRQLSDWVRDYFGFSSSEMSGFWVLISLAILLLAIPPLGRYAFHGGLPSSSSATDREQIDSLMALLDTKANLRESSTPHQREYRPDYISFDPNTASVKVLLQNGLPQWLSQRIVKFREKGGKFYVKKDLLKIYGFTETNYHSLKDFIQLPDVVEAKYQQGLHSANQKDRELYTVPKKAERITQKININETDSLRLCEVPGIGKVLSARIIKFRDKLGGVHNLQQFSEVYHLSPEAVENLLKYTYVSENFQVQKINLNTDDVSTLAKHPYISFSLAKAIVRHREAYGNFERLTDSKEVYLMDEDTFQKIAPYLSL